MELLDAMRHAGTSRYYTTQPVDDAVLHRALEAGRFAPNGGNRQPVRWIVVRDAAQRARASPTCTPAPSTSTAGRT
jgi:nitroreductase